MICEKPIIVRTSPYPVPCGKCSACLANRRSEWVLRLRSEFAMCDFGLFVTLTYDDEHLFYEYGHPAVCKRDVQLFLKRLRKRIGNEKFRYFCCSEYGDHTCRPHYHILFFFKDVQHDKQLYDSIEQTWQNGHVQFGELNLATILYTTKYVLKDKKKAFKGFEKMFPTFILTSRHPALGQFDTFVNNDYYHDSENWNRFSIQGVSGRMPRLFKDKLRADLDEDYCAELSRLSYESSRIREQKQINLWLKNHPGKDVKDFYEHRREVARRRDELAEQRRSKTKI